MKVIHCADLHLDSQLHRNLSEEQVIERRNELLESFLRIVSYAVKEGVRLILIAGDLFDSENMTQASRTVVLQAITDHPGIVFFYVTGNHEKNGFIRTLPEIPRNLKLFHDYFTTYTLSGGGLTISGINPGPAMANFYEDVSLPEHALNIVLLHGQVAETCSDETISLRKLAHHHIDYLALGHVHSFQTGKIDARGSYCYCGCPEGRGYDEAGDKGFVLLDLDLDKHLCRPEFIPFAKRKIHSIEINLSGIADITEAICAIKASLTEHDCQNTDYVKLILTGSIRKGPAEDIGLIAARFAGAYYDFKVENRTRTAENPSERWAEEASIESRSGDASMENRAEDASMENRAENASMENRAEDASMENRAENASMENLTGDSVRSTFVRLVKQNGELSEEERKVILRYGLMALSGEEVRPCD